MFCVNCQAENISFCYVISICYNSNCQYKKSYFLIFHTLVRLKLISLSEWKRCRHLYNIGETGNNRLRIRRPEVGIFSGVLYFLYLPISCPQAPKISLPLLFLKVAVIPLLITYSWNLLIISISEGL